MNPRFEQYVSKLEDQFESLRSMATLPCQARFFPPRPGVYVFWEHEKARRVGRSNNLRRRINDHLAKTHNRASFAFRMARERLGLRATYQKAGSRKELMRSSIFLTEFEKCRLEIQGMKVSFIVLDDHIEQYLLELYAAMKLGLDLSEFDNH